jgi:restriction endonuclease S subunit
MNLYLNGVEDFSIVCGDTLRNPAFLDGSHLRTFDIVLANPPYSIKEWDRAAFENDKWGRNLYGTPPQARADYAFIQHIVASLNIDNGRCAILLPHGVLNRGEEKNMRMNHVNADNIDAIIGLGRNLFYNSGLESFIMICNNNKPEWRRGNILFIEAEKLTHKEGKQAYLHKEDIEQIVNAYNNPNDIIGLSKYVTNEEIIKNGGNLNIKSYVKDSSKEIENGDPIKELNVNRRFLWDTLAKLEDRNINENIQEISSITKLEKTNWNKVCLADVAEAYSESIKNPSESEYEYFIGSDCIGQYDFRIGKRQPSSGVTSAQKLFKKGDYLLVRRSLYGSDFRERAPRADFDGICSADIITIREKDNIAPGFLIWVLYQKELWDYIVSNSTGGLTRRIKWKDLANYEFTLPSLSEQKVLADKLWAAYRVKESYKKLLAATDDMLKAKFVEMFGDCDSPTEYLSFEEVFTIKDNLRYPLNDTTRKDMHEGDELFPYYGANGLVDHINQYKIDMTAICLAEDCGKYGPGEETAYIIHGKSWVNNHAHILVPKDNCDIVYAKMLFTIMDMNKYVDNDNRKKLTQGNMKKIKILCPPLPLQQEFVAIATQAEATKESLRKSIENIDQVIKSLINQ